MYLRIIALATVIILFASAPGAISQEHLQPMSFNYPYTHGNCIPHSIEGVALIGTQNIDGCHIADIKFISETEIVGVTNNASVFIYDTTSSRMNIIAEFDDNGFYGWLIFSELPGYFLLTSTISYEGHRVYRAICISESGELQWENTVAQRIWIPSVLNDNYVMISKTADDYLSLSQLDFQGLTPLTAFDIAIDTFNFGPRQTPSYTGIMPTARGGLIWGFSAGPYYIDFSVEPSEINLWHTEWNEGLSNFIIDAANRIVASFDDRREIVIIDPSADDINRISVPDVLWGEDYRGEYMRVASNGNDVAVLKGSRLARIRNDEVEIWSEDLPNMAQYPPEFLFIGDDCENFLIVGEGMILTGGSDEPVASTFDGEQPYSVGFSPDWRKFAFISDGTLFIWEVQEMAVN